MKRFILIVVALNVAATMTVAAASPGPATYEPSAPVPAPHDRPFPGEIRLDVDASDVQRRIVRVHESISGVDTDTILLYPQWLPGTHAPEGPIDRLAGIRITANGASIPWMRDEVDIHALHVPVGPGVKTIDVEFTYLSPTTSKVGVLAINSDFLRLDWNALVLYPAGYFARQIPVVASLVRPDGWPFATALETASSSDSQTTFKRVSLETLIDSPVYAGRYAARFDLDPGARTPVHLDLFADRADLLTVTPVQLKAHQALVQQAYRLFGSRHYEHYDFLYLLSDQIPGSADGYYASGLEHLESSEDSSGADSIKEWDKMAFVRDILPHEFTHSWNGKFRRPADLWTPNYNVPMRNSLLWVYEGQTQYWGQVLATRSGLWTKQQALDQLALTAAYFDHEPGRKWRTVQDTTKDEIINPRRPQSWTDWQRFEDYYSEGQLIWLDADTLIRQRSNGKRSLDDFARAFFGIDGGAATTVTYTFNDVVAALNAVEPFDWAAFLRERLDAVSRPAPLDGLRRGGYRLDYSDTPNRIQQDMDAQLKTVSLAYSIGVDIDDKDGTLADVAWEGPAFNAKLTEGMQILAVNGTAYSGDILKSAIHAARGTSLPIELIVRTGDKLRTVTLDYHEGLRYPHLVRDPSEPPRLDDIIAARK